MDLIELTAVVARFGTTPEDLFMVIGYMGAGMYLLAYALLQTGVLRGNGYAYTFLNLFAAVFVAVSLITAFNAASLVIQSAWIVISVVGLGRRCLRQRQGCDLISTEIPNT